LRSEIPWADHQVFVFGRWVQQPRLTAWFGDSDQPYHYSGNSLQAHHWTPDLLCVRGICEQLAGSSFNSVLANLYRNGSDSIAWHADDEPELGADPVIASVNLGEERRFDLRHCGTGETVKIPLPHGSVLVMSGPTQHHWLHQVAKSAKALAPRINLTFRMVHA
ncbi:MAG: alpha-ketoglutarate-dependent dioxygenase AlkB family protein, partial [Actinomycetales bacterium]